MSRSQPRAGRWPDLLIGLLVLLLLAGFAALLLGQSRPEVAQAPTAAATDTAPIIPTAPGSDLGTGDGATTPAVTPAPTTTRDGSDPAVPESAAPATTAQAPEEAATPPQTPAAGDSASDTPAPAADQTSAPSAESATAPETVIAADPIPAAPAAPPVAPVTLPTPTTTIPPGSAPEAAAQPSGSALPRAGGAVATSEPRTPLRSDYRVSLGTFGSEGAAQGAAQGVRALGYTVYPIDLGAQVVAQVGPFADEASARQALADIQRAYPGAVLYPPRGRNLTGGSQSGAAETAPSPAAPAEPAAAVEPEAASPPAPAIPSAPVYLQIGAFDRVESAQNLVGQLREQGYAPTVNAPEGSKVTVLIGPFSGEALTTTEEKLDANGFDHFRVR
jgi:cell division septation protein DedD